MKKLSKFLIVFLSIFLMNNLSAKPFVKDLSSNPIISNLVCKLRDPLTGRKKFRKSLTKVGEYLALKISEDLETFEKPVKTLLNETATHQVIDDSKVVLITILRAGVPFFNGMLNVFPKSEAGFFAMARDEKTLESDVFYKALPDIEGKTVLLTDTMLATGGSIINALKVLNKKNPKQIIIVGAIAAKKGIENVLAFDPSVKIYTASIDPTLNEVGYIVPGLGDAGDRCYGFK